MTKTQILFLSASPEEEDQTSFVRAYKRIRNKIKPYRDQFKLEREHRLSVTEITEYLSTDYHPQIVHFFGHGEQGSLLFEDEQGEVEPAKLKPFVNMFRVLNERSGITEQEKIRLVVLVACDSYRIAKAVSEYVDCAIGMSSELGQNIGMEFAESFYFYLCSGNNVQDAFNLACVQIHYKTLDQHKVPKIVPRKNCDPKEIFFVPKAEPQIQPQIDEETIIDKVKREKIDITFVRDRLKEKCLEFIKELKEIPSKDDLRPINKDFHEFNLFLGEVLDQYKIDENLFTDLINLQAKISVLMAQIEYCTNTMDRAGAMQATSTVMRLFVTKVLPKIKEVKRAVDNS